MAATRASQYLAANHQNLQKSLDRLSSGKRITEASDDAGGLAVSMKLEHSINGLKGASTNISNAISFLQVQDGALDSVGSILSRIGELKGMYDDVTKNTADKATYDTELVALIAQINAITGATGTLFNGVNVFGGTQASASTTDDLKVYLDANGSTSLTIKDPDVAGGTDVAALLAKTSFGGASALTAAEITNALEEVTGDRATNGGQVKRLQYAQANLNNQITNMTAANGRIMDVDIATESAALARHQILVQASAAMVSQANSANNVALQLLQ
jgi:flagellin